MKTLLWFGKLVSGSTNKYLYALLYCLSLSFHIYSMEKIKIEIYLFIFTSQSYCEDQISWMT